MENTKCRKPSLQLVLKAFLLSDLQLMVYRNFNHHFKGSASLNLFKQESLSNGATQSQILMLEKKIGVTDDILWVPNKAGNTHLYLAVRMFFVLFVYNVHQFFVKVKSLAEVENKFVTHINVSLPHLPSLYQSAARKYSGPWLFDHTH
jgi:hypothetical protein